MDYHLQQVKNIYHLIRAIVANWYYGFPSKKITVIGITGTDGKTTTTALIYHILKTAGKKVSMISTVSAMVGKKSYDTGFHVTTPSPFAVQKYIQSAVTEKDDYFVLETTSHSLDQYRVYGVQFAFGVITNITHEHLLYHKTYENYVAAKTKLIQWASKGIINRDDKSYDYIMKLLPADKKPLTYGLENKADYQLDMETKLGQELAHFNKYNYLAAYAVCHELGLADEKIFNAMKTYVLPPGRMEVVHDDTFTVIVDFAHTPNAIKEALSTIKHLYKNRRLIHIFGSAAFRDDSKRPLMGAESATYADLTIITEEDYRTEDPYKIAREIGAAMIEKGFTQVEPAKFGSRSKEFTVMVERQKAIEKAIEIAQPGDVFVLTGKGHEKSLCRGTVEYPWDDVAAVKQAIASSHNNP